MFCQNKNSNLKYDRLLHQGIYNFFFVNILIIKVDFKVFIGFHYALRGAE